ncbi:unnamed protein product [Phyllotreta striolata]|uniref:Uncharacterized protein n=1 Tax=Phyllotreta striolata TaxID=444603 RepID=A0A9N9XJD0_PHYSR|nr:unnamed protein product [Phyllotreta striolata]
MTVVILIEFILVSCMFLLFDFRVDYYTFPMIFHVLRLIFDNFLILNVAMNCLTGYYDEPMQKVVLDFKSIMKHYLKTNLVQDVLSAMPTYFDIFLHLHIKHMAILLWLAMFRFLLIRSLTGYSKILANYFHINHFKYMTTMVVLYSVLFWHVASCVIEFIRANIIYAKRREAFNVEGPDGYKIPNNIWIKYVNVLHHNSLLLYNAGYGHSNPKTQLEIVLIYVVWYGSSLFCIYILGVFLG